MFTYTQANYRSGHGYLAISGLPESVNAVAAMPTFEGENYVLWQQVGRYLFKCLDMLKDKRPIDARMDYLKYGHREFLSMDFRTFRTSPLRCEAHGTEFLDKDVQCSIYRHRALRLICDAYVRVRNSAKSPAEAWNEHMMLIIGAARAHIDFSVVSTFAATIEDLPVSTSPALKSVITTLCDLFALSRIIDPATTDAITFIEDGYLSTSQLTTVRLLTNELLEKLMPDAIALTDAWDFTDASLCSAIGMKDGNVYENIMNWVEQLPINKRAWEENHAVYQPGWKKWVDPILKASL